MTKMGASDEQREVEKLSDYYYVLYEKYGF